MNQRFSAECVELFDDLPFSMMQLRLPDGVIDLNLQHPVLNSDCASVFGDRGPDRRLPLRKRPAFLQAAGKQGVILLKLGKDIGQAVKAHAQGSYQG